MSAPTEFSKNILVAHTIFPLHQWLWVDISCTNALKPRTPFVPGPKETRAVNMPITLI